MPSFFFMCESPRSDGQTPTNSFISTAIRPRHELVGSHFLGGNVDAGQCTRTPARVEAEQPVKILLAGITNFYCPESSASSGSSALLPRVYTTNHAIPARRYAR